MHTPASEEVVLPNRATPSVEIEPVVESPAASERLVAASVVGDRGLERLSPTRVAEIRMRLESGAYNSPEVLTELAMRMLESGDI
jgi:hypothetical protein